MVNHLIWGQAIGLDDIYSEKDMSWQFVVCSQELVTALRLDAVFIRS